MSTTPNVPATRTNNAPATTPAANTPAAQLKTFRNLLEMSKESIAVALPRHLTPERMMRLALSAVQMNPDLLTCDMKSVIASIVLASQLGLEIGVAGQGYLVPFNTTIKVTVNGVKVDRKVKLCQFIPGYRGLVNLAWRSGDLSKFEAHVVYKNDIFEFEYGSKAFLRHVPHMGRDRGGIIAAYAVALLKGSDEAMFEVLPVADLEKIRNSSKSKDSPAYKNWLEEQFRKAPAKRLCKWLPVSVEKIAQAIEADDRAIAGLPQNFGEMGAIDTTGGYEFAEASTAGEIEGDTDDNGGQEEQTETTAPTEEKPAPTPINEVTTALKAKAEAREEAKAPAATRPAPKKEEAPPPTENLEEDPLMQRLKARGNRAAAANATQATLNEDAEDAPENEK